MSWISGTLIVVGFVALAFEAMPYGLILLAAIAWFLTIDYRK